MGYKYGSKKANQKLKKYPNILRKKANLLSKASSEKEMLIIVLDVLKVLDEIEQIFEADE